MQPAKPAGASTTLAVHDSSIRPPVSVKSIMLHKYSQAERLKVKETLPGAAFFAPGTLQEIG